MCRRDGVIVSKEGIRGGFPEKQYLSKSIKEVMELEGRNLRKEHRWQGEQPGQVPESRACVACMHAITQAGVAEAE